MNYFQLHIMHIIHVYQPFHNNTFRIKVLDPKNVDYVMGSAKFQVKHHSLAIWNHDGAQRQAYLELRRLHEALRISDSTGSSFPSSNNAILNYLIRIITMTPKRTFLLCRGKTA